MVIRPIKTEQDYELALKRVEALMDAEADTPEAAELETLSELVEEYEERHFPMDLPDFLGEIK